MVTQRSFINGLVSFLTFNIYTPMQITATCAAGSRTSSLGVTPEALGVAANAPTANAPTANAPTASAPVAPADTTARR